MYRKRLYIYKIRGVQYRKGYTWFFKIVGPYKDGKQSVLMTKHSTDLDLLIRFRNQFLRENYPVLWRKVKELEGMDTQPDKPKIPYNYNILPQGSSPVL